jgi:hypothetical protein
MTQWICCISRRPEGFGKPVRPAHEVSRRRDGAADGGEGAGPGEGEGLPAGLRLAEARRHPACRDGGRIEARLLEAERLEEVFGDEGGIGLAADLLDDPAEQRIAEIGIFEARSRHGGKAHARAQHRVEGGGAQRFLPVRPGVVGRKPAGHGKEHAQRRGLGPAGRQRGGERRDVARHRFVEREPSPVAQQEHGRGGEALGAGGDAEPGAGAGRIARRAGIAEAALVHRSRRVEEGKAGRRRRLPGDAVLEDAGDIRGKRVRLREVVEAFHEASFGRRDGAAACRYSCVAAQRESLSVRRACLKTGAFAAPRRKIARGFILTVYNSNTI